MANIAHVREFNGTSDKIELAIGGNNVAQGPLTWLCVVRMDVVADGAGVYRNVFAQQGNAGDGSWSFGTQGESGSFVTLVAWCDNRVFQDLPGEPSYLTDTDEWLIIGMSKNSGATVPRWHRYRFATDTWTHTNDSDSQALRDPVANADPAKLWIGTLDGTQEFWKGQIAAFGIWRDYNMPDAEIETLSEGIGCWEALGPHGLWLLNQDAVTTAVVDRIGTSDEIARSGTTVAVPSNLTFDAGTSYTDEVRADNPVAWWRMHDVSGLIGDATTNDNDSSSQTGTPTAYRVEGPLLTEPSYGITVLNDYWVGPDDPTLDVGDSFTIEAWVKRASIDGLVNVIFTKRGGGPSFFIGGGNALHLGKADVNYVYATTGNITDTNWHHVVFTKDGTTKAAYIDGVDAGAYVQNELTIVNTTGDWNIGDEAGNNIRFNGTLAEIALYDTPLSAARVLAHYEAAIGSEQGAVFIPSGGMRMF